MAPPEPGFGQTQAASRWIARATVPRVLTFATAMLVLTNVPLGQYEATVTQTSSGRP